MPFADARGGREFLAGDPGVGRIELVLIDANGLPRGKRLHRDGLLAGSESGRPLP
ncbi:glutamine synthetase family protein, partial [Pseudomonas aeruginosa]